MAEKAHKEFVLTIRTNSKETTDLIEALTNGEELDADLKAYQAKLE
mgnify:FL=1